jgi:cytidylate kinase
MSVIIISSDSFEIEQKTAGLIAESIGYGSLTREDILPKVADKYKVPEEDLLKVLEKRPSMFKSSFRRWRLLLSYIQEAVLSEILKDNLICHGLAAHLYVLGVSHVLRVRVLSNEEERVEQIMNQNRIPREAASKMLEKEKKYRSRWSKDLFDLDETDSSRYDLSINLNNIDLDDAIKIIEETISYRRFKTMTYSMRCAEDLALAARARAVLMGRFPDIRVRAHNGKLVVSLLSLRREKKKKTKIIKEMTSEINGVDYVEVHVLNDFFGEVAESNR